MSEGSGPFAVVHRVPRRQADVRTWVDAGAGRFEADVQLAGDGRDGRVVVSHYLPFLRVRGWVQHDGRRFRWRGGPPFDPTLAEVLDLLPAGMPLLLDPKETDPRRRAALADTLVAQLPERGRFAVSTDHEDDLARYRPAGFATWRTVKDAAALRTVLGARSVADPGISVRHTLLDAATVRRLHDRVAVVVAWTVNDRDRAASLIDAGVDGITTDSTEVAAVVCSAARPRRT